MVGICQGNDLHVPTLVVGLHSMLLQPVPQGHVLRVAELRRSDTLAVKILRFGDAGVITHDQRSSATGCARHHAKSFTIRTNVAIDGRIRTDIGHVDCTGEEGFDS